MEYRESHNYPTQLLRPRSQSRLVREVVWVEMEHLAQLRRRPDIVATMESIHEIQAVYRQLGYSIPELLSTYQNLDPNVTSKSKRAKNKLQLTPEMIPWETIPEELILKCLDDNMELQVIDELLQFLDSRRLGTRTDGLTPNGSATQSASSSVFSRVKYVKRYIDLNSATEVIRSPVYNKSNQRVGTEYYFLDKESGTFRRAVTKKPGGQRREKVYQEVDFVVENFSSIESQLGMSSDLLKQTIWSLLTFALRYRKEYFSTSYLERLVSKSPEELRAERQEQEKEYALSRAGKYTEDTSRLWRY